MVMVHILYLLQRRIVEETAVAVCQHHHHPSSSSSRNLRPIHMPELLIPTHRRRVRAPSPFRGMSVATHLVPVDLVAQLIMFFIFIIQTGTLILTRRINKLLSERQLRQLLRLDYHLRHHHVSTPHPHHHHRQSLSASASLSGIGSVSITTEHYRPILRATAKGRLFLHTEPPEEEPCIFLRPYHTNSPNRHDLHLLRHRRLPSAIVTASGNGNGSDIFMLNNSSSNNWVGRR